MADQDGAAVRRLGLEHGLQVAAQRLQRIVAVGSGGAPPVPPLVVEDAPVSLREGRPLVVPAGQVLAEPVGEHQGGHALRRRRPDHVNGELGAVEGADPALASRPLRKGLAPRRVRRGASPPGHGALGDHRGPDAHHRRARHQCGPAKRRTLRLRQPRP